MFEEKLFVMEKKVQENLQEQKSGSRFPSKKTDGPVEILVVAVAQKLKLGGKQKIQSNRVYCHPFLTCTYFINLYVSQIKTNRVTIDRGTRA